MATIVKHVHATGRTTYKVKVRRKGYPTKTQTFDTKADAAAWARSVEVAMDAGTAPTNRNAERSTLADVLTRYRDEVTPQHRGRVFETERINALLKHPMAALAMSEVNTSVLAAWRDARLTTVSSGTVLREIVIVRAAVNRARAEWGIDIPCPFKHLTKPKAPEPRDRRLGPGEERRLYEACAAMRNTYIQPAIAFALETAMRQGEIVGLLWANVDLLKRTARLPITKSGKSRTVPLSTRAVAILSSLPRTTDFVFEGLRTYSIKHGFGRLTRRAKLPDLHFHDLRHEAISRLVERGLNLFEVAAISGHKTMDMLKRYTHLRAEDIALKLG
jgi:integrase